MRGLAPMWNWPRKVSTCVNGCSPLLWGQSRLGRSERERCFSTSGSTHTKTRHCTDQTQTFKSMQNRTLKRQDGAHPPGITPSRGRLPAGFAVYSRPGGFLAHSYRASGLSVRSLCFGPFHPHLHSQWRKVCSSWGRVSKTTLQALSSQREERTFQMLCWLVGRTPSPPAEWWWWWGWLCCLFDSAAVSFQEQLKGPPEPAWAREWGKGLLTTWWKPHRASHRPHLETFTHLVSFLSC